MPMTEPERLATIAAADTGWVHLNPDTGMEWARNHPMESGECDDAEMVEQMTYGEFMRRFGAR